MVGKKVIRKAKYLWDQAKWAFHPDEVEEDLADFLVPNLSSRYGFSQKEFLRSIKVHEAILKLQNDYNITLSDDEIKKINKIEDLKAILQERYSKGAPQSAVTR
jgi:ribosome-binding protein aMBF1 (putative translation factor)